MQNMLAGTEFGKKETVGRKPPRPRTEQLAYYKTNSYP